MCTGGGRWGRVIRYVRRYRTGEDGTPRRILLGTEGRRMWFSTMVDIEEVPDGTETTTGRVLSKK